MKPHLLGTMVLSLDVELSWGRFDKLPSHVLNAESIEERAHIRRLIALLDRYQIPATWAVTGHLMLDECARGSEGLAHADMAARPAFSWFPFDWYHCDPCGPASLSPCWYAPDIVEWIRGASVRHEIGSHSFGHVYYGEPECTEAVAESDLAAAVDAAARKGITLKSFVFPRNLVGHLAVLRKLGLKTYRGSESRLDRGNNGTLVRAYHFLDQWLGLSPKDVYAERSALGLWNIPGNHFLMGREGLRRFIPMASRVLKAKRGINRAIANGGMYHLWFHPFNLIADAPRMFDGLERILAYAHHQREKGLLQILTMEGYASVLEQDPQRSASRTTKKGHRYATVR